MQGKAIGVLVVGVVTALFCASVAEAHTLRLARAQALVEAYAQAIAEELAEDPDNRNIDYSVDECERRAQHRATCDFAYSYRVANTTDYYVCSGRLSVRTKGKRTHALKAKLARHECEQVN